MKFPALQAASAVALVLGATAVYAQGQQKSESPPAGQTEVPKSETPKQRIDATPKDKGGRAGVQTEPKDKATQAPPTEPKGKASKGSAQGEQQQPGKGTVQIEPKEKAKGSAQREPNDKAAKGIEKGAAPPPAKSSENPKGPTLPKDSAAGAPATAQRVQLSEQQRTTVHQTILQDQRANRVNKVNFSINVGARVPRETRLEMLPAAVFSIVPQYRTYRYFVVNDEICIVEPSTYEIVEVITVPSQTAFRDDRSGKLVLSDDERMIVLSEIDMRDGSTMGLGALTEEADVPHNVEVRLFPETVVQKVPKLKGYRFFTADNRIGIVDPQASKVRLIIKERR